MSWVFPWVLVFVDSPTLQPQSISRLVNDHEWIVAKKRAYMGELTRKKTWAKQIPTFSICLEEKGSRQQQSVLQDEYYVKFDNQFLLKHSKVNEEAGTADWIFFEKKQRLSVRWPVRRLLSIVDQNCEQSRIQYTTTQWAIAKTRPQEKHAWQQY